MQWHVLQAFQDPHFHLQLTTYDNLYMFDAYYKTMSSRDDENGLQYWSIQIFYDPSL